MRKNSIKNTRINGEVQKELSNIIRNEIKDPRIGMMTSVTAAEVAPDLKTCKVYISVFGDDEAKKETIRGLKSAEGFIRRMLAKTINLRNTPELTFVLDESIEYGVTMSKLIDEVTHKEDKSVPAWDYTSIFATIGRRFRQMSILRIHGRNFPIFRAFLR